MIEKEWKRMLTENQYEVLSQFLIDNLKFQRESYMQKNFYYDTKDMSLYKNGTTVRIRRKKGLLQGTVKHHYHNGVSREINFDIDKVPEKLVYKNDILVKMGSLTTHRTIIHIGELMDICLDMNIYLNTVDYEMEVEFHNEKVFEKVFWEAKTPCKYNRFISELKKQKAEET